MDNEELERGLEDLARQVRNLTLIRDKRSREVFKAEIRRQLNLLMKG